MSNEKSLFTKRTFSSIAPCLSNLWIIESNSARVVGLPPPNTLPLCPTTKNTPSEPFKFAADAPAPTPWKKSPAPEVAYAGTASIIAVSM